MRVPSAAMRGPWGIPESLSDLHGPTEGTVALPQRLSWSGRQEFDLAQYGQRLVMYQKLITEADSTDLEQYMDAAHLVTVWPMLRRLLHTRYTGPWEERFPQLAAAAEAAEPVLRERIRRARQAVLDGPAVLGGRTR